MRRSRQFGIGKEGGLSTYPGFIKFLHGGQNRMSIELSEVQWEKILKGMEKVIVVSVLLENDFGTQKDFLSADAVCVIKEISCDIRDMFILMEKSANSRARVIGRNGAGKGLLFHRGRKGKHMKRKR